MASIRIQEYRWLLELGFLVMLAASVRTLQDLHHRERDGDRGPSQIGAQIPGPAFYFK